MFGMETPPSQMAGALAADTQRLISGEQDQTQLKIKVLTEDRLEEISLNAKGNKTAVQANGEDTRYRAEMKVIQHKNNWYP